MREDPRVIEIVKRHASGGKKLACICAAPTVLKAAVSSKLLCSSRLVDVGRGPGDRRVCVRAGHVCATLTMARISNFCVLVHNRR